MTGASWEVARREDGLWSLSAREFALFQELIHQRSGIHLTPAKQSLLVGRLASRLRELGLSSLGAYYELVSSDEDELVRMLDRVCTNETHFFREPRQLEYLEREVFPRWSAAAEEGKRSPTLRVWSAACSTGEEPYTLAMMLLERFPRSSGWQIEIVATDLSTRVLSRAREGIWPIAKASEIPQRYLKAYMTRGIGSQEGKMGVGPELREIVHFSRVNLSETKLPIAGLFDLVLCRNVLIYFNAAGKRQVVERLLDFLEPGGYLLLGIAEGLAGSSIKLRSVAPSVYRPEETA
jgi:chemotaxis protein methyltransferase CheR